MTQSYFDYTPKKPITARPRARWRLLLLVVCLLGLFMIINVARGEVVPFSDSFEAYSNGAKVSTLGYPWASGDCYISQLNAQGGDQSLKCGTGGSTGAFSQASVQGVSSGTWYHWLYMGVGAGGVYGSYIANASDAVFAEISATDFGGANPSVRFNCAGSTSTDMGYYDAGTWLKIGFQWDDASNKMRCSVDGDWTFWKNSASGFIDEVSKIAFYNVNYYIDTIGNICDSSCSGCSPTECMARDECWFITPSATCEPREPVCGEYSHCFFCDNESACSANGSCFWRTDTCIWGEPTATSTDFLTYYTESTEFATPTAWALEIGGFMAGIFDKASGFVNLLNVSTTEAVNMGNTIGSAVPTIRGYLLAIVSFINGLGSALPLWNFLKIEIGLIVLLIVVKVIMMIRKFIF